MADSGIVINPTIVKQLVEQAVETNILSAVENISSDPVWLSRIEHMINQTVVQETISRLGSIDLNPVIKQYVDASMGVFQKKLLTEFSSTGILDQATSCQLTVMDDNTVVENCLTARSVNVVGAATIQNLVVTGSINTDNQSWIALAADISQKTLDRLTTEWNKQLVEQVAQEIKDNGISFDQVEVGGQKLVDGNRLSGTITESNIQSLGTLRQLQVQGEAHINDTVSVVNRRLGINTDSPEMALSVWDEEVSIVIGKNKSKQAYIGTNRDQGLVIGVNRLPQIEIDSTGLTAIKKLQVGLHKISHDTKVPGWSGTRGDIVFNSNPGPDRVFAWVCLGTFKWQTLKSAE
jgi:hypothetical protein